MKFLNFEISKLLALSPMLALAGCATTPTIIRVPVPVACNVADPARPVMPTESLRPGVTLDAFAAAAAAEIERREGYELELRVALVACTAIGAGLEP